LSRRRPPALEVPGINKRIGDLWADATARDPALSQAKFCKDKPFSQQQLSDWLGETTPNFDSLVKIGEAFGIPWQFLLVGEEGLEALKKWDADRKRGRPGGDRPTAPDLGRTRTPPTLVRGRKPA
jgi:transcriptional regulator with XRE-family HTH domain